MSETAEDVDLPYDDGASQTEKIDALEDRLDSLGDENEQMRDRLLDANAENNKYQQPVAHLFVLIAQRIEAILQCVDLLGL